MKIFNAMFTTLPGGLEQAFLDYTDALTLQGHQVTSLIHTHCAITHKIKGEFQKIHSFSKHDPFAAYKMKRIIKKNPPDAIITHGNRAHYLMQKAAGTIPVIGVVHTPSFGPIMNGHSIICVSNELKEGCCTKRIKQNQRIFHIPNMINLPETTTYKAPHFSNTVVIGMAARLFSFKGMDTFVRAMEILKTKNISFKAKIAGDGPEYNTIKSLIETLDLEDRIEMLGWVDESKTFYDTLDILCIPSLSEPFGLVVLEGFSASLPLVVSDASGPMEIVEHGKDALVFPKGDYTQMAHAIIKLINDPEMAKRLTQNGFETVYKYDIHRVGKQINDFVLEAVS